MEHPLMNAFRCAWQPRKETCKVFSVDPSGHELVVAVALEESLLVGAALWEQP
jgi:hypothetical protein